MAHAEEEEMPEDEQRESRLPGYTAKDDPETKITEGESATSPEVVPLSNLKKVPSPVGQP